jgi:arsenical pump membrane protein
MVPRTLEAAIVFAGTLLLLLIRPARVPDWAAALAGAALMLVLGVLPPAQALDALVGASNVLLFLARLGLASAAADRSGVFHAAARAATVGAANAASFLLPVSNPANLLVLGAVPLPLGAFLARLLIPSAVGLGVTLAGLLWVFREDLAAPFDERHAVTSQPGLTNRTRVGLVGVAGLGLAYVVASALGWPLGWVALVGALVLLGADGAVSGWQPREVVFEAPWSLLALVIGLLVLTAGAEQAGLFAGLSGGLVLASHGPAGVPLTVAALALLANLINNLPAALVATSSLGRLPPGPAQADLAAAVMVGVNLGPNLTTIGSLATTLWLVLLRRRGLHVSVIEYLRVGALITMPALVLTAASLWALAWVLGP